MKRIFLLLTSSALLAWPAFADDSSTNAPPHGGPGGWHHQMDFLTDAQQAELKKAHDAALAADPTLAAEDEKMKAAYEPGTPPTDAQKKEFKAFRDKLDAAMIKADPAVAPILDEIKKHHHGHGGPGGPPPPPADSGT